MPPRPIGLLVPLTYSEFFEVVPSRADLEALVARIPWRAVVMQAVGIQSVSWQDGIESSNQQRALVGALTSNLLYSPAIVSKLWGEQHRVLFTREALIAVLRIAVAEVSDGDPLLVDQPDVFTRACLAANEILSLELVPETVRNSAADLLPSELRSAILQLENPHDLLGRTEAFFVWATTAEAKSSANYSDVAADFYRFTGLTPIEFAAGAYLAFARFSSMRDWDEVERLGVAFSIEQWQAGMFDTKVVRQWIATNSVPLSKVRTEWKNEKSLSFAAVGSLWRRPVVQVEDDLYFIPVPALVENAMGDGAYFVLFDGYADEAGQNQEARKKAISKFTGFYGEFFENHVARILEHAYEKRTDARFTREILQNGDKSTDVIIAEGNDLIFVEIVSKRMNLRGSILGLKPEAIAKDIEDGVLHKAQQIHDNMEKFRKGELLPDWPRAAGQRFFPVIVAPHDRPRVNIITEHLSKRQKDDGLLAGAEPPELLDLGELEQLENGLAAGVSLSGLLDRKNRSTPQNRLMSLHNYLYYAEPGILPAGMSPTRQRGSEVARRIMALAHTWAAPIRPESHTDD
jgi:hypothetical protein